MTTRTYTPAQARALHYIIRAAAAHIRAEATRADSKSRALRHEDSSDSDISASDAAFVQSLRLAAELHVLESASELLMDAREDGTNAVQATDGYDLAAALAYNMALHMNLVEQSVIDNCRGALRA